MQALIEHQGAKPSYLLAEDNDPTGGKSGLARTLGAAQVPAGRWAVLTNIKGITLIPVRAKKKSRRDWVAT